MSNSWEIEVVLLPGGGFSKRRRAIDNSCEAIERKQDLCWLARRMIGYCLNCASSRMFISGWEFIFVCQEAVPLLSSEARFAR